MPYEYCTYIFVLKLHSTGLFYVIYLPNFYDDVDHLYAYYLSWIIIILEARMAGWLGKGFATQLDSLKNQVVPFLCLFFIAICSFSWNSCCKCIFLAIRYFVPRKIFSVVSIRIRIRWFLTFRIQYFLSGSYP